MHSLDEKIIYIATEHLYSFVMNILNFKLGLLYNIES